MRLLARDKQRALLAVYILCFGTGVFTHGRDFLSYGLRPYDFGHPFLEVFWSSLILLDAAVIALLILGRRRSGLVLATAVMCLDVSANAYASGILHFAGFHAALPLQGMFLAFVLVSLPLLWPRSGDC